MRKYMLVLAFVLPAASANAATKTTNFNPHIKLANTCTVVAGTMEFGSIAGTIKGTEKATTLITVSCNKGAAYTVTMSATVGFMTGLTKPTDHVTYSSPAGSGSATSTGASQGWLGSGQLSVQVTPSAQDYSEVRLVTVSF